MFIPQGDWIVVMRPIRESNARGTIIKAGLTKEVALKRAHDDNANSISHNYWAMPRADY